MKYLWIILFIFRYQDLVAQNDKNDCHTIYKDIDMDSISIFTIEIITDYQYVAIKPNIFNKLSKKFTKTNLKEGGNYKVFIEIVSFNKRIFINDVKIENCDNELHIWQINSIIKSCTLTFCHQNFKYQKDYPSKGYFIFYLTPK